MHTYYELWHHIQVHLFAFKITYGEHYNGNISATLWKTKNVDQSQRGYQYIYDDLNRLKATGGLMMTYNVTSINYDKNGNLLRLQRHGHTNDQATQFGTMDNLHYFYDDGNKLMSVTDTGNKTFGFKDGTNTGDDYAYDVNGNMKSDLNKGITDISYNHLNLPVQVTFASGNIQYVYSADGTKLKKAVSTGTETLYAGNYIYEGTTENAQLQFFNHPEGYVTPDGSGGYDYVYNYVDHLGNIRLSYKNIGTASSPNLEILEENNYYPFGMKHKGYNNIITSRNPAQNYKYNGKELNEELGLDWYDYGARNYDAALGRWMNIDPLAEDVYSVSTYTYAINNPIYFIDPDGILSESFLKELLSKSIGKETKWINEGDNNFSDGKGNVVQAEEEPPVNLFGESESSTFLNVVNNFKYEKGDGKFFVFGHSNEDYLVYTDENGKKHIIRTAEQFNKLMSKMSPEWKQAMENGKEITLTLYSCNSASEDYIDNKGNHRVETNPIAKKISKKYSNVTVIAADGYVNYGGGKIKGVRRNDDVMGGFVVLRNGERVAKRQMSYNPKTGLTKKTEKEKIK